MSTSTAPQPARRNPLAEIVRRLAVPSPREFWHTLAASGGDRPAGPRRAAILGSLLWLPYAASVAVVLWGLAIGWLDSRGVLRGEDLPVLGGDGRPDLGVLLALVALHLACSAVLGLLVVLARRGGARLERWLDASLMLATLAGRPWAYLVTAALAWLCLHWFKSLLGMLVLMLTGIATNGYQDWSVLNIVVVAVGLVAVSALWIGGAPWANQYGRGVTGGMPFGCVVVPVLLFVSALYLLMVMVIVLLLLCVPSDMYWVSRSLAGDDWNSPTNLAVGAVLAVATLLPPFLHDAHRR